MIQRPQGHTARASYACRKILGGESDQPLQLHPQCQRMFDLLARGKGNLDPPMIKGFFADHQSTICKHPGYRQAGSVEWIGFTVDSMLFDCTNRDAHLSRGPGCSGRWKTFTFA